MSSVYSKNLPIFNAENFKMTIEDSGKPNVYLTFGKVVPWANEAAPPQANTSVAAFNEIWDNMLGAKQVQGSDVRLAIPRHDWTTGTVYIAYDDCSCAFASNTAFYVVTDEWNVYKCLANNNGKPSTVKPFSVSTQSAIEYNDNYIWKYMYTLDNEERLRFVTPDFVPVKTLVEDNGSLQWQVQTAAVQGSIESVAVTNGGSNYTSAPTIKIVGDGSGANAIARINTTTKVVESIIITNRGAGYTIANVVITSAVGGGATARAIMSPPGGHGYNAVDELGGSNVIINIRLRGDESGVLDTKNEFRQVALIKNPTLQSSGNLASNLAYSQTSTIYVDSNGSEYQEDEIVYQGSSLDTATFRGVVASWVSAESRLELINVVGTPKAGLITGNTSKTSRQYGKTSGGYVSFIDKDLKSYSGSLLYINNITAIQRADDQTEDFKITLSF